MDWYGESYRLDGGGVLAGPALDFGDWSDHYDDATHIITAGDDIIVGSYADPADFAAFVAFPDPIAARWVLEVAGGSGTIQLSAGIDPDFGYDNPALASQALGSFTIDGPTRVVTPALAGIDKDMLAAQAVAVIVRIQCTAGSVDVAQVKLRVWPVAGASGAWVPAGEGSATNVAVRRWDSLVVPDSDFTGLLNASVLDYTLYPDPHADDAALDAQDLAVTALASKVGHTANFGNVGSNRDGEIAASQNGIGATLFIVFAGPNQYYYTGGAYIRANLGVIVADIAGTTPDTMGEHIDPNEHQYETEAYVRPLGGGPLVPEFGGWTTAALEVHYTTANPSKWAVGPAVLQQHDIDPDFSPAIDPDFGYSQMPFQLPVGGAQTAIPAGSVDEEESVQVVPLTGGQGVMVAVQTPGILTPAASAKGLTTGDYFGDTVHGYEFEIQASASVIDTGHLVLFGPLEVYDPAAIPTPELEPRFFVVYEGEDRAVGFGKPDTELAVFGVQTSLGNYRDLTFDEYASVDGPLPDFAP